VTQVTVQLDDSDVRRAAEAASRRGRSLAEWAADVLHDALARDEAYERARRTAIEMMSKGFDLGGKPLTRDEVYDRRAGLR
jgi:hypothetical protein